MKKIVFIFIFCISITNRINAATPANTQNADNKPLLATTETVDTQQNKEYSEVKIQLNEIEKKLRGDFAVFLDELYKERLRTKTESALVTANMKEVLNDIQSLINESRKEIVSVSYSQNKNILIASIFLWISITIFIAMNLIFANNLKKELYFLRNGLLRSEIKDNMIILSEQLNLLNEKLDMINKIGVN